MDFRYWDANVFLGWLKDEADKVDYCRPVIEAANAGKIKIVTSALTITEVLWMKGQDRIPADSAAKVEAFFKHEWIVVRELDRFIAEDARALVWDKNVTPKDAIHVATALKRDVALDQLDTFDEPLMRLSGKLGNPPLIIGKPNVEATLPLFEEDDSLEPTEPSTSTEPPPPSSQSDDDE